jgi:two-component system, cell cycle response regulator
MVRRTEEVTVIAPLPSKSAEKKPAHRSAHLILLSGTNVGQVFELKTNRILLGRDEEAEVQILDAGISRHHAVITRGEDGNYYLEDAGSRNGTFANNHRVESKHELQHEDKIQIGVMTILKFCYTEAPEADYAYAMYEAALRDGLTGAFNRRYFEERLRSEFAYAIRHETALALLITDLDHFKQVNDSHGHVAGDQVLREFSKLVDNISRAEDVLCRYGGEEFALLCRDTNLIKASVLGERVRHRVSTHTFPIDNGQVQLTVSIGISALPDPVITEPAMLVEAADAALYQAKQRGRNCIVTKGQKA